MTFSLPRTLHRRTALAAAPLLMLAVAAPTAGAAPASPRIVSGSVAPSGSWASIAALRAYQGDSFFGCGATVISARWVVTAAHCTFDDRGNAFSASQFEIITGRKRLSDTSSGQVLRVDEVRRHPAYDDVTTTNDIALLRLSSPTNAPPMQIARQSQVSTYTSFAGVPNTAGWGLMGTGATSSDSLLQAYLPLRSNSTCAATFPTGFSAAAMVCAGDGTPAICEGDSGGPLIVFTGSGSTARPVLWGITSFRLGDRCGSFTDYFTRVAAFTSFIAPALDPPARPAPPATPAPAPGPNGPSVPFGSGASHDRTAPRLSKFRIPAVFGVRSGRLARKTVIRLRASEKATLRIHLYKRSGSKLKKVRNYYRVSVRRGTNRISLPRRTWRVKSGSYQLKIVATDRAGNTAAWAAPIKLRRGR